MHHLLYQLGNVEKADLIFMNGGTNQMHKIVQLLDEHCKSFRDTLRPSPSTQRASSSSPNKASRTRRNRSGSNASQSGSDDEMRLPAGEGRTPTKRASARGVSIIESGRKSRSASIATPTGRSSVQRSAYTPAKQSASAFRMGGRDDEEVMRPSPGKALVARDEEEGRRRR